MAAGSLPTPGSKYGPCAGVTTLALGAPCAHRDCAETRTMADTRCRICGEPIGYETGFFCESDGGARPFILVHADCLYREVEEERKR